MCVDTEVSAVLNLIFPDPGSAIVVLDAVSYSTVTPPKLPSLPCTP